MLSFSDKLEKRIQKVEARFVRKTKECWHWTGRIANNGYSKSYFNKKHISGHRLFYIFYVGAIPHGKQIDHLCRVKACVNPKHLEAVTAKENTLRCPAAPAAINKKKVKCKRGHFLSDDNLYITPDNRRQCRTCNNERSRKYVVRRKLCQ